MVAHPCGGRVAVTLGNAFGQDIGSLAQCDDPDVDQLLRHRKIESEQPLVLGIEAFGEASDAGAGRRKQRHFKGLAGIAHVDFDADLDLVGGHAFGGQFVAGLGDELTDHRADFGITGLRHQFVEAALGIDPQPGGGIAIGAQYTGRGRDNHRPRSHQHAHGIAMQRASAAKGHQREIARVITLLNGH